MSSKGVKRSVATSPHFPPAPVAQPPPVAAALSRAPKRSKRPEMRATSQYFAAPPSESAAPKKTKEPVAKRTNAADIPTHVKGDMAQRRTKVAAEERATQREVEDTSAAASSSPSVHVSVSAVSVPPLTSPPPLMIASPSLPFAARALRYFEHLGQIDFGALPLPPRVTIVNPYSDPEVLRVVDVFLHDYCSASEGAPRVFMFGINPGRFGAGITGVPFTDTTALRTKLKIESSLKGGRREASGEFIWQVIESFGARPFFSRYWITSLFPLCLLKDGKNYNFYDDPATFAALRPFIVRHLEEQRGNLGAATSVAVCIGTGQNQRALQELNVFYRLFDTLLCVEHPRFIVQYKRASMHAYLEKYRETLERATDIATRQATRV